jgi:hypothetical protein
MIIVKYSPDGMKSVIKTDVDRKGFWEFYKNKKAAVEQEVEEDELEEGVLTIDSDFPKMSFTICDERLAASEKRYVARPDDWPITCGEPL